MRPARLVVVGADAAGMSSTSEARRVTSEMAIVAFDRGRHASYSQCGLGGVVESSARLTARSIEPFARREIDVRLSHEVVAIDAGRQVVRVRDIDQMREFDESYDYLLVATGGSPLEFPLPGRKLEGIFHLDVMEDALRIDAFLQSERPRRAVIVGGGYVGLEMAENLSRRGLMVSMVERGGQLFPAVDFELVDPLQAELERNGVDVSLCDSVAEACEGRAGRVEHLHTSRGPVPRTSCCSARGYDRTWGPRPRPAYNWEGQARSR